MPDRPREPDNAQGRADVAGTGAVGNAGRGAGEDRGSFRQGMFRMTEAFICDAVRTPIGRFGGALAGVRTDDLAALPIRTLVKRTGIDPAVIDEVFLGCANQAGED